MISYSANVNRPLRDVMGEQGTVLLEWHSQIEAAAVAYAQRKRDANSMDYDDLLLQWGRLIREFPDERAAQAGQFRHILIDEMQDTNAVQIEIVEAIAAAGAGNLTAVGDDAQSIYRFRGADYDNILKFPERHPGSADLPARASNYRSTPQIVALTRPRSRATRSVSPRSSSRPARWPACRWSSPPRMPTKKPRSSASRSSKAASAGSTLRQMAVLYRNHHDSILLQGELLARGIPYTVRSGLRFFEQAHIKDVLAHLRIVLNPRDEASWRRLLLLLPGIGAAKAAAIFRCDFAESDTARGARIERGDGACSCPEPRDFSRGSSPISGRLRATRSGAQPGGGGRGHLEGRLSGDRPAQV